jgi:tetratricopeptide (TPR) repeat protein
MTRRRWNLLLAIALLALVLRLVYIGQISQAPFTDLRLGDAEAYHQWALRIAGGDWLGTDVFYQAPLYPYFLAVIYRLFGDGVAMVRVIQAAIGAGSCVLLAAAGIALFGEWGAIAGVLLAIYPTAIFFDGLLEKSALVTVLTAALLYVLSDSRLRFREFLAGAVLGLLSLTRENALLLLIPAAAWFLIADRQFSDDSHAGRRWRWHRAAALLGGCALVLLPVGARNYARGGEFHLTTSQFGPNFYIGNHAGARGLYDSLVPGRGNAEGEREDATRLAEQASSRTLSPDEVSSFWTARALEFIRTRPGEWARLMGRKLALTFNAVEIADTESQEVYAEWSSLLRALSPVSFGVIFCLAAFGVAMTAGAWRRLWFLHAIALTYTLSIIIFYVFARYRFPLVPVLMLFAAGGIASWREWTGPGKAGVPRRGAFAAAVLAAGLTYLPLESTRMDRVSHYVNIGNLLLRYPGRWEYAAAHYHKALKESPRDPAAHYGIGMLLALKQRPEEALAHYRTAVQGWPDNANIRVNFALALADVGNAGRAFEELDEAARLRAADPTAYLMVGNLMLKQSRHGEAAKAFERALAIDPANIDARRSLEHLRTQAMGTAR